MKELFKADWITFSAEDVKDHLIAYAKCAAFAV